MFFLRIPFGIGVVVLIFAPFAAQAASSAVVISEIAAFASNDDGHSEWIEIHNRSYEPVDITGWTFVDSAGSSRVSHGIAAPDGVSPVLEPGAYAIIAYHRDRFLANHPEVGAAVFDSSWGTLNESGEYIALLDANGAVVDELTYGAARDHSLERVDVMSDDASASNWVEYEGHTAGGPFVPAPDGVSTDDIAGGQDIVVEHADDLGGVDENIGADDGDASGVVDDERQTNPASDDAPAVSSAEAHADDAPLPGDKRAATTTRGWGAVRINEFVADPTEYDTEWIEIVSMLDEELDLSGWALADGSGRTHKLEGVLPVRGFAVFDALAFQLNNGGDEIVLLDQWGFVMDRVAYGSWVDDDVENNAPVARKPESLARSRDGISTGSDRGDFAPTLTPTRGFGNRIVARPQPDAEMPKSRVRGGKAQATSAASSRVLAESAPRSTSPNHRFLDASILISELLPNPSGADGEREFIELFNPTDESVPLAGWSLVDASGARYVFEDESIAAQSRFVVYRHTSNIPLNNSTRESVTLLRPDGSESDRVSYEGAAGDDWSYARDDDAWMWTTSATPHADNVIAAPNLPPDAALTAIQEIEAGSALHFDASDSSDRNGDALHFMWTFGDRSPRLYSASSTVAHVYQRPGTYHARVAVSDGFATSTARAQITVFGEVTEPTAAASSATKAASSSRASGRSSRASYRPVSLHDMHDLASGDRVIVEGAVLVEPGVLGAHVFYIGSPGLEVYMYNRDFPPLSAGDVVRVRGEISLPSGVHRLKIKSRRDVSVLRSGADAPSAVPISLLEVEDELVGDMVMVQGEVVSKTARGLVIESDEGDLPIVAASLAPLDFSQRVGDVVAVTGILSKTKSGFRLMPRSDADIAVVGRAEQRIAAPEGTSVARRLLADGSTVPALMGGVVGVAMSVLIRHGSMRLLSNRPSRRLCDGSRRSDDLI